MMMEKKISGIDFNSEKKILEIEFSGLINFKRIHYNGIKLSGYYFRNILSLIANKYMWSKEGQECVNISAKQLCSIGGNNYRQYLNWLKENEIVYIIEHYSKEKKKSKQYGFTNRFKSIQHDVSFKVKYEKRKRSDKNSIPASLKKRVAEDFKKLEVVNRPKLKVNFVDEDGNTHYDFKNYLKDCYNIYCIANKVYFYHWKDNRLYSNFHQISSVNRARCFSFGGKLLNKDIKSSYPTFLAKWLKEKTDVSDYYEFHEYCFNVFRGDIYSQLTEDYEKHRNMGLVKNFENRQKIKYEREDIKEFFQIVINGKNGKNEINYSFFARYPLIFEAIKKFKEGKHKSAFFLELSALESDFLFNVIINRLNNEVPGIKIATVHDQIYYDERYSEAVKEIWNEEMAKLYDSIYIFPEEINVPREDIEEFDDIEEFNEVDEVEDHNYDYDVFDDVDLDELDNSLDLKKPTLNSRRIGKNICAEIHNDFDSVVDKFIYDSKL